MTEDNRRRKAEILHEIAHLNVQYHDLIKEESKRLDEHIDKSDRIANKILLKQEELQAIEDMEEKMKELK